jgi:integrase
MAAMRREAPPPCAGDAHEPGPRQWERNSITLLRSLGGSRDLAKAAGALDEPTALFYCCENTLISYIPRCRRGLLRSLKCPSIQAVDREWSEIDRLLVVHRNVGPKSRSMGLTLPKPTLPYLYEASRVLCDDSSTRDVLQVCRTTRIEDLAALLRDSLTEPLLPSLTFPRLFTTVGILMRVAGRSADDASAMAHLLPASMTPFIASFDRISALSEWHAEALQKALESSMSRVHRTAFAKQTTDKLRTLLGTAARRVIDFVESRPDLDPGNEEPFRWFVSNCTTELLKEYAKYYGDAVTHNQRGLRGASSDKNAFNTFRAAVVDGLGAILPWGVDWREFTCRKLRAHFPVRNVDCDDDVRRTLNAEEIDALLNVASSDARWNMVIILLREVAPRVSAIAHLRYSTLLDEIHAPRHTCRILEKGRKFRTFVTSSRLKAAIKRYSDELRQTGFFEIAGPNVDPYLLNTSDPTRPLCVSTINVNVKRLANLAGIQNVRVHPHMFRHTIVGELVDAGNSLETVSRFMGHANVDVTARHYWVPTASELYDKLANPWTGRNLDKDSREGLLQAKEALEGRCEALEHLLLNLVRVVNVTASQEGSAVDALARFVEVVPSAEETIKALMASTVSHSVVAREGDDGTSTAGASTADATSGDDLDDDDDV